MPLGTEVGIGPCHIVLDGDPTSHLPTGAQPQIFAPNFRPTSVLAKRIKMPLGTEVGLGPGHIVLHGDSTPPP